MIVYTSKSPFYSHDFLNFSLSITFSIPEKGYISVTIIIILLVYDYTVTTLHVESKPF